MTSSFPRRFRMSRPGRNTRKDSRRTSLTCEPLRSRSSPRDPAAVSFNLYGSACGPVIVPVFKTGGRQVSCRRCVRLTLASANQLLSVYGDAVTLTRGDKQLRVVALNEFAASFHSAVD